MRATGCASGGRRTEVHVPLRWANIAVACKLLNVSCWRAAQREMRAEMRLEDDVRSVLQGRARRGALAGC